MTNREARTVLTQVAHIRAELLDPITPRRKMDALVKRINKRLTKLEELAYYHKET